MGQKHKTSDAVEILHHLYFDGKPEMMELLEAERIKLDIAQQVYDLRETAGLTQAALARQIGVNPSIIQDLEESAYEGDAFLMLNRIATVLNRRVEVHVVPLETQSAAT
jgi:ribosome-binding protein aMBF1 (putative translation factor)